MGKGKSAGKAKIIGAVAGVLLVTNFIFMLTGVIQPIVFWVTIIFFALLAYWILPKMRK